MIVYLAMIFVVFEILSMIFNQYFIDIDIVGITFPLNISVVFFCLDFFILDLVTEIYNKRVANKIIYGKIICQILFIIFGEIGVLGSHLEGSQLYKIISTTPYMILNSIIASIIGYKITINLMEWLKIKYNGDFLIYRYLSSTLPGEIIFSLIFSILSFAKGKSLIQFVMIFLSLTTVKITLSLLFSLLIAPLTKILRQFHSYSKIEIREYLPFT